MEPIANIPVDFYVAAAPVLILVVGSVLSLLFPDSKQSGESFNISYSLFFLTMALLFSFVPTSSNYFFNGSYVSEGLAKFGQVSILSIAIAVTLLFRGSFLRTRFFRNEVVSLYLMTVLGMLVMVSSQDLVTLFVGLELNAIGLYVLVGYVFPNRASLEGAIKYFILGSFASAILLFGFGLLYASSGSMNLLDIVQSAVATNSFWPKLGALFVVFGFAFKLALMPFHMWAPDTYESAPTGITALMATASKIMILVVVMRFMQGVDLIGDQWVPTLFIVSCLSMVGANILALVQSSVKRMLAYSSIAQSGYMAIAICSVTGTNALPYEAVMFYLIGYALTSLLAFGTLMWLESESNPNIQIDELRGLIYKHPWAAFSLAAAMFSFAGMPPTVGFFGKFFVFNAALKEELYYLVVIGAIGSTVSLYYYLRVAVVMFMQEPQGETYLSTPRRSSVTTCLLGGAFVATLLLGTIFPEHVLIQLKPIAEKLIYP